MFRKVLIPTDFSDEADRVLKYVSGLKGYGLRDVTLVHVVDVARALVWPMPARIMNAIESKMEERRALLESAGFTARSVVLEGNPSDEVLRLANEGKFSLIVTGSHGKHLIEEILLGSISEALSREAKIPVLLIRYDILRDKEKEHSLEEYAVATFKKVLFPSDFSPCATEALGVVKGLRKLGVNEVFTLHIVDPKKLETEQERKELLEACEVECGRIGQELKRKGFKGDNICRVGDPLTEILQAADEFNTSLIVMGSHGKSVVKEWLVGSISLNVVRTADRPALIVHAQ